MESQVTLFPEVNFQMAIDLMHFHLEIVFHFDLFLLKTQLLDTWSGFEAANTAPWPSQDSTTLVNSLSPQMS